MRLAAGAIGCLCLALGLLSRAQDQDLQILFRVTETVLTASPAFEKDGDLTFLKLARGTNVYRFPWAMPPHYHGKVLLESNRLYRLPSQSLEFGIPRSRLGPTWSAFMMEIRASTRFSPFQARSAEEPSYSWTNVSPVVLPMP